jgi:hypothetical protein
MYGAKKVPTTKPVTAQRRKRRPPFPIIGTAIGASLGVAFAPIGNPEHPTPVHDFVWWAQQIIFCAYFGAVGGAIVEAYLAVRRALALNQYPRFTLSQLLGAILLIAPFFGVLRVCIYFGTFAENLR